jgi:hypothetical protein
MSDKTEQTWTFVGHWDEDRIVVEYVLPGEQEDQRIDTGFWEQGLWASSGTGATMEEAQASAVAEYEAEYHDEPEEHGLVGMQRERYDALMDQVGDHDAALKDARAWPAEESQPRTEYDPHGGTKHRYYEEN